MPLLRGAEGGVILGGVRPVTLLRFRGQTLVEEGGEHVRPLAVLLAQFARHEPPAEHKGIKRVQPTPTPRDEEATTRPKALLEVEVKDDVVEELLFLEAAIVVGGDGDSALGGRRRVNEQPGTRNLELYSGSIVKRRTRVSRSD